ncbi:GrpE-domain-containing protein [Pavlovales sp. CCMP2436]|nr:GrpE-domain-containing protein [Pavlovales sp. CCMP2436]
MAIYVLLTLCAAGYTSAAVVGARPSLVLRSSVRSPARVFACAAPAEEDEAEENGAGLDSDDDAAPEDGTDSLLSSPAFMKKKIQILEDELAQMQLANAEMEAKLREETNSPIVLRLQADFENFRRRTREEILEQKVASTISCVQKLLPVLDNFDRATALKLESAEAIKVHGNYQQLYKSMLKVFTESFGCTEVEAVGKPFDFNLHEAIMRVESAEIGEGDVVAVLQRGFVISGKLVRPAGVSVSAGPGAGSAAAIE